VGCFGTTGANDRFAKFQTHDLFGREHSHFSGNRRRVLHTQTKHDHRADVAKDGLPNVRVDLVPETGYADSDLAKVDPDSVDKAYFVPKTCNHCEDAPCTQVCPVHASYKSPEGFELIDFERCIGCAYCVQSCPYGVRFINHETGTADKCTWCYHRVMRNDQPACVEACPVGARLFGRVDDPKSEISKRMAEIPTQVLKEHLGTHPKTRYVGITEEVT
jgi:tetrathionate reductase subunit B